MYHESKSTAKSEEFLSNLIDKRVLIVFKDGTDKIGTLVWDDKHAIGVKFLVCDTPVKTEIVLYYKSFIKGIKEK